MIIEDDRSEAQKQSHTWLVIGTDKWLSGWGKAEGGKSFAVWACEPRHFRAVTKWAEERGALSRIRWRKRSAPYKPSGRGHTPIYVVEPGHPAIEGLTSE